MCGGSNPRPRPRRDDPCAWRARPAAGPSPDEILPNHPFKLRRRLRACCWGDLAASPAIIAPQAEPSAGKALASGRTGRSVPPDPPATLPGEGEPRGTTPGGARAAGTPAAGLTARPGCPAAKSSESSCSAGRRLVHFSLDDQPPEEPAHPAQPGGHGAGLTGLHGFGQPAAGGGDALAVQLDGPGRPAGRAQVPTKGREEVFPRCRHGRRSSCERAMRYRS